MVAHADLPEADLHELKGASTATVGQTPVADGAGSTDFKFASPRGAIYFVNLATPYTLTYPSVYTKVAPTTTVSGTSIETTEATTSRITYTGTDTLDFKVNIEMAIDQAAGANRDIEVQIYKNGAAVTGAQSVVTTVSGGKEQFSFMFFLSLATNDYIEIFAKNAGASGDLNVYSFFLSLIGFRG